MKKRRKIISFLLTLSLALGLFCSAPLGWEQSAEIQAAQLPTPTGDTSGTCGAKGDNIEWELIIDPDGTIYQDESRTAASDSPVCYELQLTGTGEMEQSLFSSSDSPWFNYRKHITSLTISEGITSICDYAFWEHCSLSAVTLPDSVASIGISAFFNAYSLKTITCGAGLKEIKASAFQYLPSLADIQFNDGLEKIGEFAFQGCEALKKLSLPGSLASIPNCAFSDLTSLTDLQFSEGLKEIGTCAFQNCSALERIVLPESLVTIEDSAFCFTGLTDVTLPKNVEHITGNPFVNTPLKTLQVEVGSQHFFVRDNILYEKDSGNTPKCAVSYAISVSDSTVSILPETSSIGINAFAYAKNLTSINFPETLTNIGSHAFYQSGLQNLDIPGNVKKIGPWAFANCH